MGKVNPALEALYKTILDNPNKYTVKDLSVLSGLTRDTVSGAIRRGKEQGLELLVKQDKLGMAAHVGEPLMDRPEMIYPAPNTENVMVIGDIHPPYDSEEYLAFCKELHKKYKITHVIFAGDVTDQHSFSRFDKDPDMPGAADELDQATERLQRWYRAFTKADMCAGNHDLRYMKRAYGAGLPRRLIRSFQSVFGLYQWNIREAFIYDGIRYIHGEGGSADKRAQKDWISTVQGHEHPQAYVKWFQGHNSLIFAMQVGCGIDAGALAFDYAKHHRRPILGVGIILDHGKLPFNVIMN